jgi:hypothetical protein
VTLVAGAAVALGVLGGAWALQAATLPPPDPGDLVAARAMSWLAGDRIVDSAFVMGKSTSFRSRCARTWIAVDGAREPAVRLTVAGRTQVVPVGRPFVAARGRHVGKPRGPLLARLQLAGCPPVLQSLIAGLVRLPTSTPVGRARLTGRPVLTLRIWTKSGRLTVYLEAGSKRPVAVGLAGPRLSGQARLRMAEPPSPASGGGA